MDLLATIAVTIAFIGLAWLVSWRIARPYSREDASDSQAHGDIAAIPSNFNPSFHATSNNREGQPHHG